VLVLSFVVLTLTIRQRKNRAGRQECETQIQLSGLAVDAVCCGCGYWSDVFRGS
jgi:hypothetical protein